MKTLILSLSLILISPNLFSQSITIGEDGIVRCKDVPIGTTEVIFGETYEVVDRNSLMSKINDGSPAYSLCVSNITDMSSLFNVSEFNETLDKWDVSNVTNMKKMFRYSDFNQDISNWDVNSVTDMSEMFESAAFNKDISNWDVSSVTDMSHMFQGSSFNQNINNWDVSSVLTMRMMFAYTEYNQPIGNWNVSNVTNFSGMFVGFALPTEFNQDISNWDVSSAKNMSAMFLYNGGFNQPIGNWDVSSVTDMSDMFNYARKFNQTISDWQVFNVNNMTNMFMNSIFNNDISSWCVPLISSQPKDFVNSNSQLEPNYIPIWGSCPGIPSIPIQLFPSKDTTNISRVLQINWSSDTLSTHYQLQVFEGFDPIVIDTLLETSSFTNSNPLKSNTTYYWRVRGINQADSLFGEPKISGWSNTISFITGEFLINPPESVKLISPTKGSLVKTLTPTLKWKKDSNSNTYTLQVSTDKFSTFTVNESLNDTLFTTEELSYNTQYTWRVRGSNSTGDGEWSDEWSFSTKKEKPLIVKNSLPKVVTCGSNTLILKENGYLYGVGNNSWGQLGNGTLSTFRVEEWNQDVKMIDDFIQVRGFPKLIDFTCSNGTVYGVDESMDVWAVGNNSSGQTSVTDSTVILNPTKMNLDFKVSSLSSKTSHLLLINQDSTILYSLGRNSYGQLGNDNIVDSHIPQKVFEAEEGKIWSISTGGYVSGLLTSNGDLYLWGYNGFIQVKGTNLGSGNLNDKFYTPEFIMGNVKMFELGLKHTLAIDSTGQLTLWGYHRREGDSGLYNEKFYVENIVIDNQTLPELISQGNEVQLKAGNSVTMLVVDSRYLILWGEGDNGVLGNNNSSGTAEKQVIDILDYSESRIESIDLANNHVSVLLTSGELISWGNNRYSANGHSMEDYYKFDEEMGPSFGVQTPTLVEFKANQHFNINETENSFTPEIVHTSVTNDEFKIKVKSDEFHKFILSRSISGDDFKMIASFDSVYQDTSLESSTNYFYEITSLNKGGVQSPPISLEVKTQSNFYLHGNGITVMCPEANVGDVGEINGVLFTKRITDEITIQNASTTCTSGITSFYELFKDKTTFNEDIGHWDVSSVKDMFGMFWGATRFNVDISNWDVSNVTNMAAMFYSAKSFNQNISIWNTGNVEHMGAMFSRADSFNQSINTWDVSQVKNLSDMFAYNPTFNQPLSDWITSSVTDIHQIFLRATSFNQNINGWNVSNVTNMQNVFHGASSFNQPLDKWDVRKVVNFNATFKDAKSFNQDLSSWKLYSASVTNVIFSNSNVQNLNYTKMLNSWANDDSTMIFNTFDINSTFNQDAEAARSKLIEEFKWTINDEGFEPYSNQSPNLLTPFNEQINVGKLTEFTWDDLENTTTYQVQIAQDSQFGNILFDSSGISQPNLTLQVPLDENYKYQWRVRGLHSDSTLNTEWSDTLTFTTGIRTSIEDELIPQQYILSQNYPNPFNPSTQIQYALPEATQVTLEVFNSLGQKVMELVNGQQSAGYHSATFDASGLSSGVYLYKLTTPSFSQTNKMLLIK